MLKDHSVAVEGLAAIIGAPDENHPLDVVSVPSVLGKVHVVGDTELCLTAAAEVPVGREREQVGICAVEVGLGGAVVVQLVDVAVVLRISTVLLSIHAGRAGEASTSRKVELTI